MVVNFANLHQYHSPQKNSLQNFICGLSFEVYLKIFILCECYFNSNIFHMFKLINVCWSFFLNKIVEV
jgi:hypothetical protein